MINSFTLPQHKVVDSEPASTLGRSQQTESMWRVYRRQLLGFIRRYVDDDATSEDLLQEVFLRMHRNPYVPANPRAWLYKVTRGAIADHFRARRPMDVLPDGLTAPEPERSELAVRELAECLRPMIERLPEPYREAVYLSEVEGWTQKDVAKRQGVSLPGAKSRVQRGRARLNKMLTDCCTVEQDRAGRIRGYEPNASTCKDC